MRTFFLFILGVLLVGCAVWFFLPPRAVPLPSPEGVASSSVSYVNQEYGFSLALPESWKNYTVHTDLWHGTVLGASGTTDVSEQGPLLLIRHPLWTSATPRQDIPVMVFTLSEWGQVSREELSLGAAPIGPSELGRNSRYVFALPARYNFAFLSGFEEVDQIIRGGALRAF
jgi:hypothetical protein